jgi:hypothetical protein
LCVQTAFLSYRSPVCATAYSRRLRAIDFNALDFLEFFCCHSIGETLPLKTNLTADKNFRNGFALCPTSAYAAKFARFAKKAFRPITVMVTTRKRVARWNANSSAATKQRRNGEKRRPLTIASITKSTSNHGANGKKR